MESSQAYEECHSSESGWTMYIGSPAHDDDDDDDDDGSISKSVGEDNSEDENDNGNNDSKSGNEEDEESDDSMASDASSGPSFYQEMNVPRGGNGECSPRSRKAFGEQEEVPTRRGSERRRPSKEEADRSEAGSKVRKNLKLQKGSKRK